MISFHLILALIVVYSELEYTVHGVVCICFVDVESKKRKGDVMKHFEEQRGLRECSSRQISLNHNVPVTGTGGLVVQKNSILNACTLLYK